MDAIGARVLADAITRLERRGITGQQRVQGGPPTGIRVREDECFDQLTAFAQEHVLGTAQPDAGGAASPTEVWSSPERMGSRSAQRQRRNHDDR